MAAFTSTSDSKSSASPDPAKKMSSAPPPLSVMILTIISLFITIPMIALSVVNFGMLSIWLNSTVAILIFIYHFGFLVVVFIYRKRFSSTVDTIIIEQQDSAEVVVDNDSWVELDQTPSPSKPPSIAFTNKSIMALIFLFVANTIAFCVMADVTTLGVQRGTLPAERLGSHPWNINIQMAQTAVLGCQLLTIGALLGITFCGRRRIILEEESRSQEVRYII